MTGYAGAQWIPSPFYTAGRNGYTPRWLILHGTAGGSSAQNIAAWFQNPSAQVSAHYVVGQDGAIIQTVSEDDWAWANGVLSAGHDGWWSDAVNPNWTTISIEHVKPDTQNASAITAAQQAASFKLIKDICSRWNIPMRAADANGGITGHYSIDPVNRSDCPGPYPWTQLWSYLDGNTVQGGSNTMTTIPAGWRDDGTTLTAPNGIPITQGFRTYVLGHNWDAGNYPVEKAQGLSPLELSNTNLGAGTRQTFRTNCLEWTSKMGVFESWVGAELYTVRNLMLKAQSDLATTQASLKSLQDAWNKVVPEKNSLVAQVNQLNAQIAQLKAAPGGNTEQLQQQLQAATTQIQTLTNKLAQITSLANQVVTVAKAS